MHELLGGEENVLGRRKASGGGGRRLLKAAVAAGCVVGVRFRAMPRGGRWGWGGGGNSGPTVVHAGGGMAGDENGG
jgi:hypothetical protein